MNNKKILVSFILVVLIALSVASVSAEDATDAVAVSDDNDDAVAVSDDADVISAATYKPENNNVTAVQDAINKATNSGDTVDLSKYAEYDFGKSSVTISNSHVILKGNGSTVIKGWGANTQGKGDALIMVTGSNVTIQGITFIDTHESNNFTYGGTVYGTAIQISGAKNGGLVSGCEFNNFSSAVIVQRSNNVILENNYVKGGYTTLIANDPTVNTETGSKSFNIYGQSAGVIVRGNTFEGQVLDAVSIAQGSGSNIVENNVFIGNTYSMYFGGDATKGSTIRNNTFRNCGYFKEGNVEWKELPIISIQKASNDISIVDNTFEVINDTVAIAAEQGNEAHGFPSSLGNINVTGNTVTKYAADVNASSVVLFHILVRSGEGLHIFAPVKVVNNALISGMDGYQLEIKELGAIVARGDEVIFDNINTYFPTANTVEAVQAAIDSAVNPGDVVDLGNFETYDFGNGSVSIKNSNVIIKGKTYADKNGNFQHYTYIKGWGSNDQGKGNALFEISGSNVTVKEFDFTGTYPKNNFTYNGTVYGAAVRFAGVKGGLLTDCIFNNLSSAVIVQRSSDVVLENNYIKGGYSTIIANDPTVNVETGSKSFNIYGQSNHITVRGNTFEGKLLDGVSIAQGSGSNIVENNKFIDNTYGIYFGGDATKGSVIRNNTFINCGHFEEGTIVWTSLPIISIQKASNDISIVDNTFKVVDNSIAIAAEQGNEAHGFPSSLGNINVTGSTIEKYEASVDTSNVTLFHVLIRDGNKLNTFAPLIVQNNDLAGSKGFIVETMDGIVLIDANQAVIEPTISATTKIETADINYTAGESGTLKLVLTDEKGNALANKTVFIMINGETNKVITSANGSASLDIKFDTANTYYATIMFMGDDDFKASTGSAKITVNAKPAPAPAAKKATTLTAKKATLKVKKAKKIKVTLKSEGKAVSGKQVTIKVNKKTFKGKTNAKGVATIKVKVTKKGKYTATVNFAGDNTYNAATKKVKLTVKK
jgi:parallel beta-helix repeat protein